MEGEMIGPDTILSAEFARGERELRLEAAGLRARLLADEPGAKRSPRHAVATWLRALAARLAPESEPRCCTQLA